MSVARLLHIFGNSKCVASVKMIHGKLVSSGLLPNVYNGNHLIGMYVDCHSLEEAYQVFVEMPERNLVSWTRLVFCYTEKGFPGTALELFRCMVEEGFKPNEFSYVAGILACTVLGNLRMGKEIHAKIFRCGYETNMFVTNTLINLYAKCCLLLFARRVFNSIAWPNLVSWTSLVAGYAQCGQSREALYIFRDSQQAGIKVNPHSSAIVLGACASISGLFCGQQIHAHVIKCGIELDSFVENAVIDMYAKCGELDSAHRAFKVVVEPSVVSWTTHIAGYAQKGEEQIALNLFAELHASGPQPNEYTLSCVLGACGSIVALEQGRQLHSLVLKTGYKQIIFVGNAMLDMYCKCGLHEDSLKVFEEMIEHDVVSWNTLIAGHAHLSYGWNAIKLFKQMMNEDVQPTVFTYSCILSLCGNLPAPEWGRQIHCYIIKPGFNANLFVGNSLVDMYANSGRIRDAVNVFNGLPMRNLVTWNTILMGYAQHGFGREALEIFGLMQEAGLEPNDITFLGVLTACGRAGLVEEGCSYFESMSRDHGIVPRADHHACVVDLLGRAGQLLRAYEFIMNMPSEPDKVIWRCLLSACVSHKDIILGKFAAEHIIKADPQDISAYVMLANIFSDHEMWEEAAKVRWMTRETGMKKDPGCSWIELNNEVHAFISEDRAHLDNDAIYDVLYGIAAHISDAGYVPDMGYVCVDGVV
ncbi:pentatricopeptide repeat-containing protein At4g39530-like [Nymphaea colorata]|nr:pentatricopeptide repeat-containing protein At4g39530-like [Nymphaea colorata]XP_031503170.1 pentatricopeptide repeat-containing protein At4g39530-like [Nymphaea colorata]XP_049936979.1 pentatricopeptide repeat-containing protein At4g39530-like [Nymphaea colorata]